MMVGRNSVSIHGVGALAVLCRLQRVRTLCSVGHWGRRDFCTLRRQTTGMVRRLSPWRV
jgi:hypothetical protein